MLRNISILIFFSVLVSGCASLVKPENIPAPKKVTCINIEKPIVYTYEVGPFDIVWEQRIEQGLYYSEKDDGLGTYYRGAPGSLYKGRPEARDKAPGLGTYMRSNGGIWIPHAENEKPRLYTYFAIESVKHEEQQANIQCSSVVFQKELKSKEISILKSAVSGSIGGISGKAIVDSSSISYAQAGVGGAVAGVLIAGMINSGIGKISLFPSLEDETVISKIRSYSSQKRELQEVVK